MERRGVHIDDVFDIGDGPDIEPCSQYHDGVVAAIRPLSDEVIKRVHEIDIVAAIAGHPVATTTAIQNVGTVIADQDVIIGAADPGLDIIFGPVGVVPGKDRHVVDVSIHARELSGAQV